MDNLEFSEISDLLGSCRLANIEKTPVAQLPGQWELYRGAYKVHLNEYPFEVLYLQSRVSRQSILDAKGKVFKPGETQVVYAPSLDKKIRAHEEAFKKEAKGFWSTRAYLASFMTDQLQAYRSQLRKLAPEHYIDPWVGYPAGGKAKYPNPVELFLTDPSADDEDGPSSGGISVVLAEAGHGKTYMSEHIVSTLARSKPDLIPVYVSASQWLGLGPDDIGSLEKTITHSFRHFGTPIGWIMGNEDQFLRVALKSGLFRLVFDGFDEYILRRKGARNAVETLQAMMQLVEQTGARIVLTARTSFWHSEVEAPTESAPAGDPSLGFVKRIRSYPIKPFDRNNATLFFEKRLSSDSKKVKAAVSLFDELAREGEDFAGRGFVLSLISDLVQAADSGPVRRQNEKALAWLMRAHCERDRLRHNLSLTSDEQLGSLRIFAFECAQGAAPNSLAMEVAIADCAPHLSQSSIESILTQMSAHALIVRVPSEDRWRIREEQVEIALLSQRIIELAESGNGGSLAHFAAKATIDDSVLVDVAYMMVELLHPRIQDPDGVDYLRQVIGKLLAIGNRTNDPLKEDRLRLLSTLAAIRETDRLHGSGAVHLERTRFLLSLFPNGKLVGLPFIGTLQRFDFSGATFERCRFRNVRWVNCRFDEQSSFVGCNFVGGSSNYCHGFGGVRWQDVVADEEGKAHISGLQIGSGRRRYSEDDLKADIRAVVEKFVGKGGAGFKKVKDGDLGTGKISVSEHRTYIIEEIQRSVLDSHTISGQGKGWHLKEDAKESVRFFMTNNHCIGPLGVAFERAKKKLGC